MSEKLVKAFQAGFQKEAQQKVKRENLQRREPNTGLGTDLAQTGLAIGGVLGGSYAGNKLIGSFPDSWQLRRKGREIGENVGETTGKVIKSIPGGFIGTLGGLATTGYLADRYLFPDEARYKDQQGNPVTEEEAENVKDYARRKLPGMSKGE